MNVLYTMQDCQAMHRQHPETFEIPNGADILALEKGDFVKVIFEAPISGKPHPSERMWVEFDRVEDNKLIGKLNNDPFFFHPEVLKCDDLVEFKPQHIASIMRKKK